MSLLVTPYLLLYLEINRMSQTLQLAVTFHLPSVMTGSWMKCKLSMRYPLMI